MSTTEPLSRQPIRELSHLSIRTMPVSQMDNNVYLLTCRESGEQLMIDAADEAERCLDLVRAGAKGATALSHVVTTHRHWDHVRALAQVVEATGARTAAGAQDADDLPLRPDRRLEHGDTVTVGAVDLEVIHLRGHTAGSVALAYRDPDGPVQLFTGDSLFPGGVGRTADADQSFEQLYADVLERIFDVYDDDTHFHPGHGDGSTLGAQRPQLPQWRERGW